jgi:hypothetical protein
MREEALILGREVSRKHNISEKPTCLAGYNNLAQKNGNRAGIYEGIAIFLDLPSIGD